MPAARGFNALTGSGSASMVAAIVCAAVAPRERLPSRERLRTRSAPARTGPNDNRPGGRSPVRATCSRRSPSRRPRRCRGGRQGLRGVRRWRAELREPEVDDLHVTVVADHDVLGLEIAMDDARGVRLGQTLRGLMRDVGHCRTGRRPRRGGRARSRPHPFHRDERPAGLLADVVDGQDVRMIQRGGALALPARTGGDDRDRRPRRPEGP